MDLLTCQALGFRADGIADLSRLGLSADALEARRNFIGGSDATTIGKADPLELNVLARFKRGLEAPNDLSDLIYVQLGNWTEPFILAWAEKILGVQIERRGELCIHRRHKQLCCTLDGWVSDFRGQGSRVIQVKHVNAFSKMDEVVARYEFQRQHEIACAGADGGLLVVLKGTQDFLWYDTALNHDVWGPLLDAELAFWEAVQEGRDPAPMAVQKSAVPVTGPVGEQDMSSNNAWADAAARYRLFSPQAELFEKAVVDLKAAFPREKKRAFGNGLEITQTKAGALTIKKLEERGAKAA